MTAIDATIQLAHGGGGRLSQQLLQELLLPAFGPADGVLHDAALLASPGHTLAFTTDSYVVRPLFFPGGNIGELAVFGSVNDLAMAGARPVALSLGLILEEGLELSSLKRVIGAIRAAADRCHGNVITGDTQVVERGKGDGIFINPSAIGVVEHPLRIHPLSKRAAGRCRAGERRSWASWCSDPGGTGRAGLSLQSAERSSPTAHNSAGVDCGWAGAALLA